MTEVVSKKEYDKIVKHSIEALKDTINQGVERIPTSAVILLREPTGKDEYGLNLTSVNTETDVQQEMFEIGQRAAVEPRNQGFIPVTVAFVSEAWRPGKSMTEKQIKAFYDSGKRIADLDDKVENVVLSIMRIDGVGEMYLYPIHRDEDNNISISEPMHHKFEDKEGQNVLCRFYEGVASALVDTEK